ncbi:MAG: hypothetical protein Q8O67_11875 [Deltaproteobacteria bacterium]|nr:hypothetical protein [Deltaproteobacteria bacterium]
MLFALATALVIGATPAVPVDSSLLERARNAERELEYQQAKLMLVELFAAPGVTEPELIEGHLLAGSIERVLENDTEARLHFLYVLRRKPDHVLADDVPPKVRNFFELVREEVRAEIKAKEPVKVDVVEPPKPKEPSLLGPVVAGVGGLVAASGVVAAMMGETQFAEAARPFDEREAGRNLALLGWTSAAVGVGVGVAGAVLIFTE